MKSRRRALLWRLELAVQRARLAGFQRVFRQRLVNVLHWRLPNVRKSAAARLASMQTTIMRVWQLGQRGRSIGVSNGSEKDT